LISDKIPDKNILCLGIIILVFIFYNDGNLYNKFEPFCEKKDIFLTDLQNISTVNEEDSKIKYTPRMSSVPYSTNLYSPNMNIYDKYNTSNLQSYDIDSTVLDRSIYQNEKSKRQAIYNANYNQNTQKLLSPHLQSGIIGSENLEWWQSIYE